MRSVRILFTGQNQVEIQNAEVAAPGSAQVLVQARKSLISTGTETICLSRNFEADSHWDRWVRYPFAPGYSLVGTVVEVGKQVSWVRPGQRVALRQPHQQYMLAEASNLYLVPDGISDEEATWFGLANIVQNGVRRASQVLGESVVVIGLGLLGQLVVQYMRLLGARHIIAIDMAEARLTMAKAHGATTTLAMDAANAREAVLELTEGRGADVVYDVTGVAAVFEAAQGLLCRFGRLVLLGDTGMPSRQHLTGAVITRGLQIIGAHDTNPPALSTDHAYWDHQQMARLFFTYVQRGDMRVADLITHRYTPSQAPEAYALLLQKRESAMGVIFDWTSLPE
uniref:Alcohol dehydrogenase n=1 Tax=Thermosporothrix sp. COM3 TaxID=2490863 RepID=A0A455SKF2_9CHLR|nr:alcohol dehydrogenase [Thermosporothrix sp. COM3]